MIIHGSCCCFLLALRHPLSCSCCVCQPLATASSNDYTVYMEERRYDEPQLVQDSDHQILSDILGSFPFCVQGQAFYNGKEDLNKFYPIVIGKDIAAYDADEGSASSFDQFISMGCAARHCSSGVTIPASWSPVSTLEQTVMSLRITHPSLKDEYAQSIVAEGAPHKHYGGGHVNPNKAVDPGLAYGKEVSDYARFLCAMGPVNSGRTARVQAPAGTTVRVEPSIFNSTGKNLKF
ncbi:subtilisin-like protease SBT3.9 [Citrus sinensis]|nr:subtilisin-like protease SBT3.9 [Citrus sinensis]